MGCLRMLNPESQVSMLLRLQVCKQSKRSVRDTTNISQISHHLLYQYIAVYFLQHS